MNRLLKRIRKYRVSLAKSIACILPISKGFTLIEVLVSMTILLIVCLVIFNMFHAALKYSGHIKSELIASVIADKKIEEIRAWAYKFDNTQKEYNFNLDWSGYSPYVGTDPLNPKFEVSTKVRRGGPYYNPLPIDDTSLYFPSTGTEKDQEFKRIMNNSMVRVQVKVSWDDKKRSFTTVTCIAEPTRQLSAITITPISVNNPVLKDEINVYEAQGYDQYNKKIYDLVYKWYVYPKTGNGEAIFYPEPDPRPSPATVTGHDPVLGTGSSSGDPINYPKGKRAAFVHRIRSYEWTPMVPKYIYINPEGTCKVMVRAQSGGVIKTKYTGNITVRESP